ncbi:unnamed protein product [Triticum turgidum subsp. durum]|uniref:Uncharacterized protein n=1 Tax=Triticum turgidum subsp. durum TaxID=4567 RepID=A0A9R1RN73_TRITD|nr:unnamed protein product [Triticum turgidum subsp. durum]
MIRAASPRPPSAVRLRSRGASSSSSACPFRARGSGSRVAATSGRRWRNVISCCSSDDREGARGAAPLAPSDGSIQLYSQIEKVITEAAKQSNQGWSSTGDWTEIEGAWVLRPKSSAPSFVVHFIGGIFVGAAPQVTYRYFLERLADKGALVIATPYASGFDHFFIADQVQFKFDRCLRNLVEPVNDLPTFGVGHSLGSVIHLLIGSRYAVQRSGNILMSFNNKEASLAIPLFSPVIVPMAQSFGPILSQLTSSPTIRFGLKRLLSKLRI